MMSGSGLLGFLIYGVVVIIPFWRLLPRFGIPNYAALVAIIPVGAIILLWIMAFREPSGTDR